MSLSRKAAAKYKYIYRYKFKYKYKYCTTHCINGYENARSPWLRIPIELHWNMYGKYCTMTNTNANTFIQKPNTSLLIASMRIPDQWSPWLRVPFVQCNKLQNILWNATNGKKEDIFCNAMQPENKRNVVHSGIRWEFQIRLVKHFNRCSIELQRNTPSTLSASMKGVPVGLHEMENWKRNTEYAIQNMASNYIAI